MTRSVWFKVTGTTTSMPKPRRKVPPSYRRAKVEAIKNPGKIAHWQE